MKNEKNRRIAYANLTIIAINFLCFGYLEIIGSTENGRFMIEHGAMYTPAVLRGEYWRCLTAVFMHFGIGHILNNMLILYVLGDNLERALGSIKYAVFYLVCGIGANLASFWTEIDAASTVVSAGASGAVFGVIGGLLYAVLVNHGRLEDLSARQLIFAILLSLYFGFTSQGINNTAHIAGLVLGILMGALLYRKPKNINRQEDGS